jgi:alginate O-acetyltransferase complex protein AlgI
MRVALTFAIVLVGWVFFRAPDLGAAVRYLGFMSGLGPSQEGAALVGGLVYQPYYVLTAATAAVVTWSCPQAWEWTRILSSQKAVAIVALFVLASVVLMTQAYNPFIYFIF